MQADDETYIEGVEPRSRVEDYLTDMHEPGTSSAFKYLCIFIIIIVLMFIIYYAVISIVTKDTKDTKDIKNSD